MTPREKEGISRLFEAFTKIDSPDAARFATAEAIRHLTDGSFVHIMDAHQVWKTKKLEDFPCGELDYLSEMIKAHAHYTWKNPGWKNLPHNQGKVYRHAWAVGEDEWYNSEFHTDFAQGIAGLGDTVVLNTYNDNEHHWVAGICHPKKDGISRQAMETIQWLLPHIHKGLGNFDQWQERWSALQTLADTHTEPMAVVQLGNGIHGAKLLTASTRAMQLLGLQTVSSARNLELAEFLRVAPKSILPDAHVLWKARDGQSFELKGISTPQQHGLGTMVVRFEALKSAKEEATAEIQSAISAGLTLREAQVFVLLARGLGDREIACDMGSSAHTVRAHLRSIYKKWNVSSRVEAINYMRKIP